MRSPIIAECWRRDRTPPRPTAISASRSPRRTNGTKRWRSIDAHWCSSRSWSTSIETSAGRCFAQGDAPQALALARRALSIQETEETKSFFVQRAKQSAPTDDADRNELRSLLTRALAEGWTRPSELSGPAAGLFKAGDVGRTVIERVMAAWPRRLSESELWGADGLAAVARDRLLRALLESAPVQDVELGRFLTSARFALLEQAVGSAASSETADVIGFYGALAQQCFINEYVFACTPDETRQAAELAERLGAALASGASVSPLWPIAVAAYIPLHSLACADLLAAKRWPDPIPALLEQQLRQPMQEREIRSSIPALTAIRDDVSLAVRRQYEDMPYPRWVKAAPVGKATTIGWYLRNQFPAAALHDAGQSSTLDVLIAGCGTGQHAVETAERFAGAKLLAIDLSLTSLSYAERKARELGLRNIDYAQADILELGSIGRSFDLIEASGVLHHLGDPATGWRVLLSLLRPGGFMHIGLYSALARQDVVAARRFIAERGYGHTAEDIRQCRQELLSFEDGHPLNDVANYSDFFTTSECRDLIFHAQEHQLTIPQIKSFLQENDLQFIGFSGQAGQLYRRRFPDDKTMADLDRWHLLETENPKAFVNMYQVWVQKPAR
jgi:SAM-dependent methyltransferase